jgi:CDP-glycerol glycerophosphotransferase
VNPYQTHLRQSPRQPLITIVVPVFNISSYLPSCLDSVCGQQFREIEVIAVDGASTDGSGAILDARASCDARLTILHEEAPAGSERVGPGRARNAGLKRAAGEYVWFIDGDDTLTPGCLTAIAQQLIREDPDVLLVDHEILLPDGSIRPGYDHNLLAQEATPSFTLAERPDISGVRMASWNKVVRREFLLRTGVTFLDLWPHEDVPFSAVVLTESRSISVHGSVCYRYRADRPGSAMRDGDRDRHFRVFDAWTQALERALKLSASGDAVVSREIYRVLFERAVRHCAAILSGGAEGALLPGRRYVAQRDRRRFFEAMHRAFVDYAPEDYQAPGGFRGVKFGLIQKDQYLRYRALRRMNAFRVWLRGTLAGWRTPRARTAAVWRPERPLLSGVKHHQDAPAARDYAGRHRASARLQSGSRR